MSTPSLAPQNVLSQNAVLATLNIQCWSGRKKDLEVANEVLELKGADKGVGLFTKRLLEKGALKKIHAIIGEARTYHKEHTSRWMIDGGRLLPITLSNEYMKKMRELKEAFDKAVEEFVLEYPGHVKGAERALGKLFKKEEYPEAEEMTEEFAIDVVILPCPTGVQFGGKLDEAEMQEIKAELKKQLEQKMDKALDAAMKDIGKRVQDVVKHMSDKLKAYKPPDKVKKTKAEGVFKASMVANVQELAELLPAFNLNNDPKLVAIHKRILKDLCAVDAETLREDEGMRNKVAKAANEILDQVKKFVG